MKTIFAAVGVVATLAVGSISVMALAGNKHHGSMRSGHIGSMIERVGDKLDLSAEQKTQLTALATEARPVMQDGRQMVKNLRKEMMDFSSMGADYETRMIQLADEQAERTRQMILQAADIKLQVSQILNHDQLVKLQELSESRKGRWLGKRHGRRFGGHEDDLEDSAESGALDQ